MPDVAARRSRSHRPARGRGSHRHVPDADRRTAGRPRQRLVRGRARRGRRARRRIRLRQDDDVTRRCRNAPPGRCHQRGSYPVRRKRRDRRYRNRNGAACAAARSPTSRRIRSSRSIRASRWAASSSKRCGGTARCRVPPHASRPRNCWRASGYPNPESVLGRFAHQLSGGMAQRVAIALALDRVTEAADRRRTDECTRRDGAGRAARSAAIASAGNGNGGAAGVARLRRRRRLLHPSRGHVRRSGRRGVARARVVPCARAPVHRAAALAATPHNASREQRVADHRGHGAAARVLAAGCHFAPRCPRAEEACTRGPIPLATPTVERSSRCLFALQELEAQR